jgi:hypothetical protein
VRDEELECWKDWVAAAEAFCSARHRFQHSGSARVSDLHRLGEKMDNRYQMYLVAQVRGAHEKPLPDRCDE